MAVKAELDEVIFDSWLVLWGSNEWDLDVHRQASPLPCNLDVIVCRFGHEEFPWDLHLGRLSRKIAKEATFFLNEEELG